MIDAVFAILDTRFDVEIGKREDFDAMTERETISTQNICFRDVAIDVADEVDENENFVIDSKRLLDNVSIKVDSLDKENIAKNVDIAIIAFVVSIDTADDCFDVEEEINNAITASIAFDV